VRVCFCTNRNSTARSTSLKATLRRQRQCAECGSNMLINGTMCARIRRNVWDCTVKSIARPVTARRRDARSGGPRATTTTTNFCYNYLTAQPSRNSVALGSRFAPTDRRHVAAAKEGRPRHSLFSCPLHPSYRVEASCYPINDLFLIIRVPTGLGVTLAALAAVSADCDGELIVMRPYQTARRGCGSELLQRVIQEVPSQRRAMHGA